MSDSLKKPNKIEGEIDFTIDDTKTSAAEMPSVTKLLNRKSLGITSSSKSDSIPPPFQAEAPSETPRAVTRAPLRKKPPLFQWTQESLKEAQDPFHQGVSFLIQKGVREALLLTPQKPNSDGPAFISSYAYAPKENMELWRGFSLKGSLVPDLWKEIVTSGFVELSPTTSKQTPSQEFVRKALGLTGQDWLILVRCGSPEDCTGLLALISSTSMSQHLIEAFSAPDVKAAA